jgi:hypothetical protein
MARITMSVWVAVILLGMLASSLPTDHDLATRVEDALRASLHPRLVHVTLDRRSPLTTTVDRMTIRVEEVTAATLPFSFTAPTVPVTATPAPVAPAPALRPVAKPAREVLIRTLTLDGRRLILKGVPIEEMRWELHDVRVPTAALKTANLRIAGMRSAVGTLVFTEAGVTQCLATRKMPLTEPHVRLTRDGCTVAGRTRGIVALPVEVTGRLVPAPHARLLWHEPQARVGNVAMPTWLTDSSLSQLNPLVDINALITLPAPLVIHKVIHEEGRVRLEVSLHFPDQE